MSKISLKHSGGNVVSLNSPTSAPTSADVAFKLPNADGSSGQAIVTDASGNLSFAGTGKILQVVQTVKTDTFTSTSTSYTDVTGMSVSITPSSSSNKVLVTASFNCAVDTDNRWSIYQLVRGSTALFIGDTASSRSVGSVAHVQESSTGTGQGVFNLNIVFLDSPNTTSATTYKIQGKVQSGATFVINRSDNDTDADYGLRTASSITVQEVAA